MRLCVEQDVLFPNIPEDKLEAFQADPLFQRFSLNPAGVAHALPSQFGPSGPRSQALNLSPYTQLPALQRAPAPCQGQSVCRSGTSCRVLQPPVLCAHVPVFAGLTRGLVSCTGSQFCGVAIIETKNRAMDMVAKLEQQLDFPRKVRMHWTGCPNSCGQVSLPARIFRDSASS